ncbi:20877_t:CDS:2 [Rhizophagus irregularis]|uniref:Uncharacterized protein n=1 Tax=Rhizophagus irregularis (strain DAOM 181602 / DAOM 197198 / MUCL 43194) TaxID=747089 RepID=U9T0F4_RHIID|nr:20877_t:CDS:2 [Rhizophagus irregularis]
MFFPPLEKINVIDASDYKALGDALAIVCLHRIYGKVINSELIESELTNTRILQTPRFFRTSWSFADILPDEFIVEWVVKQALERTGNVSITNESINSSTNIVEISDVFFLYNVVNC